MIFYHTYYGVPVRSLPLYGVPELAIPGAGKKWGGMAGVNTKKGHPGNKQRLLTEDNEILEMIIAFILHKED